MDNDSWTFSKWRKEISIVFLGIHSLNFKTKYLDLNNGY